MPATKEPWPDHGDETAWADLSGEQTRCLLGLKSYYVRIEDKDEMEAREHAWVDLKREFPELNQYIWFKGNLL